MGERRDDLLAQERAAVPLDQSALGIHLVGAVDGQVDLWSVIERDEPDAETASQLLSRSGRRNGAHVESRRDPGPQRAHETLGGASAAET